LASVFILASVVVSFSIDVPISIIIPILRLVVFTTAILASNSRFFDVASLVQGKSVVENDELN